MCKSIKRLAIVAILIAAAISPSVAAARPILPDRQPYWDAAAAVEAATPAPVPHVSASSASGFSWHDAALGAAGMLVLVAVGSGTLLAVRRRAVFS
jgi:hypothetical protein